MSQIPGNWLWLACPHCAGSAGFFMPLHESNSPSTLTCAHCRRMFHLSARVRLNVRIVQGFLQSNGLTGGTVDATLDDDDFVDLE